MHKLAKHYVIPAREFSAEVIDACQRYNWPGNLSELESFVKRYLVSGDGELTVNDFEPALAAVSKGNSDPRDLVPSHFPASRSEEHSKGNFKEPSHAPRSLKSMIQSIKGEAERNAIGTALQQTGWNRKAAARLLQVSYRTLLYKIDQYHMSASEPALPAYQSEPALPAYQRERVSLEDSTAKSNGKR